MACPWLRHSSNRGSRLHTCALSFTPRQHLVVPPWLHAAPTRSPAHHLPALTSGQVRLAAAGGEGAGHTKQDALQATQRGRSVGWGQHRHGWRVERVGSSGAGWQGSKWRAELAAMVFCQPLQQQSLPYAAHCAAAGRCEPHTVVSYAWLTFLPANSSFRLCCLISPPTSSSSFTSGTASPACGAGNRAGDGVCGAEAGRPGSGWRRRSRQLSGALRCSPPDLAPSRPAPTANRRPQSGL